MGVICGGRNTSTKFDDDKQLVINPVYADETNETVSIFTPIAIHYFSLMHLVTFIFLSALLYHK